MTMRFVRRCCLGLAVLLCASTLVPVARTADHIAALQAKAIAEGRSPAAHWGTDPQDYTQWGTHSNRLVPVYTFGTLGAGPRIDLTSHTGANSPYRREDAVRRIYGRVPTNTVNPDAEYLDQTNLADLQRAALAAGKRHVFLVVFDGMDWQTTRAAAIYHSGRVAYDAGRGTGLHFQDYTADGTTQFGYMVTSPHNNGTRSDVDRQTVLNPGGEQPGGYNARKGGPNPWTPGGEAEYLLGMAPGEGVGEHAYPDSAAAATAMVSGVKTYNDAINVGPGGELLRTIFHEAQDKGYAVGAVSSVPISHATPAAAYAHNVSRSDYQDLTRDLLGLRSISHPDEPLPGLDVLIGGGFADVKQKDPGQGANFVPGNVYLTETDLQSADLCNGGRYVVAVRTPGVNGREQLLAAARRAVQSGQRLLGFYGLGNYKGHLPYRTADGDYKPVAGRTNTVESYSAADVNENPTLADMTEAAIEVLARDETGFWLMVEPGDVDWANHDNNLDNSIGAVLSGDAAVRVITDWVERHSNWDESLLIVTADHGHYLFLDDPALLVPPACPEETRK